MIARPKMSHLEWRTTERASPAKLPRVSPVCCKGAYYDAADSEASPVVQAFAKVAEAAKKTGATLHSLPTSAFGVWARGLALDGGLAVSRRQSALFGDRLDANGDGVVSRSEFADWLYPPRKLDDLHKHVGDVVAKKYDGAVANLWKRLLPFAPGFQRKRGISLPT